LELDRLAAGLEVPGLGSVGLDAHHVDRLLPRVAGRARLVAQQFQSGGEIEAGRLVAPAGDTSALQQVVREEAQGRLEGAAVDGLGRLGGACREEQPRRSRRFPISDFRGGGAQRRRYREEKREEEKAAGENWLPEGLRPELGLRVLHER